MDVLDSRGSGRIVNVGGVNLLPPVMDRDHFPRWVRQQIASLILHEVDENLRQDGVLIFDPHKA